MKTLITRFCSMCGIVLAPGVMEQFSERMSLKRKRKPPTNLKGSDQKKKPSPLQLSKFSGKKAAKNSLDRKGASGLKGFQALVSKAKGKDTLERRKKNIKVSDRASSRALKNLLVQSSKDIATYEGEDEDEDGDEEEGGDDDDDDDDEDEKKADKGNARMQAFLGRAKISLSKEGNKKNKKLEKDEDEEDEEEREDKEERQGKGDEDEGEGDESDEDEENHDKNTTSEDEEEQTNDEKASKGVGGGKPIRWEFVEGDIEIVKPMVKVPISFLSLLPQQPQPMILILFCQHLNVVDFSKGYALYFAARSKRGRSQVRERLRLLELAAEKFEMALVTAPTNFLAIHRLGCVFALQAKTKAGGDVSCCFFFFVMSGLKLYSSYYFRSRARMTHACSSPRPSTHLANVPS